MIIFKELIFLEQAQCLAISLGSWLALLTDPDKVHIRKLLRRLNINTESFKDPEHK